MHSHTNYTSLATIKAQFHFTQTQHFYSNFVTGNNKRYLGPHVEFPICGSNCNEIFISQQILMKVSDIKFHKNQSSGRWGGTCRQVKRMMKRYEEANRSFCEYMNALTNPSEWWVHMWTEWATSELQNSSRIHHQTKYASAQHTMVV